MELRPEQRRLLGVLSGHQREVHVDAKPKQGRGGELAREVGDIGLGDAGDADPACRTRGRLLPDDGEDHDRAVAAHRALREVGQPSELALRLVAPPGFDRLTVLAAVLANLVAEDVQGVLAAVAPRRTPDRRRPPRRAPCRMRGRRAGRWRTSRRKRWPRGASR